MPYQIPQLLIIDDQMQSIALLLGYFKGHALEVMVALGGRDGLRKAFEGQPDAILLDVAMGDMDGFTVCRRLKADARTRDIPIIFLSANTTVAHKLEGFAAGGVDYIGKPFSAEEVLARIYVHLRLGNLIDRLGTLGGIDGRAAVSDEQAHDEQIVAKCIALLQNEAAQWEGLEPLVRAVGTNEKRLTDLFRTQFGLTVYEYFMELRLEQARVRLTRSNLQVQQIAELAGYQNASDFSRAFRRRYGVGPRQYRQGSPALPDSASRKED